MPNARNVENDAFHQEEFPDIMRSVAKIERTHRRIDLSREQIHGETFHPRNQKLIDGGIKYGSFSELVVSRMLQKYLAWEPVEGKTYQVPIGYNKHVDFYIPTREWLIEYHPIVLRYEIQHRGAAASIQDILRQVPLHVANKLEDALSAELRLQYFKKRRFALDYGDGRYTKTELMVLCSGEEFVERVLVTNGVKRSVALSEWKRLMNSKRI